MIPTIEYKQCKICLSKKKSEDYAMLGLCGHKFCKWCLRMQIGSALRNHPNADLPLTCAECNEYLPLQVLESCGGLRYYYKLLYAAMKHLKLQDQNANDKKSIFEWCDNPKCKGVYCKNLLYSDQTIRFCRICHMNLCLICGRDVIIKINL